VDTARAIQHGIRFSVTRLIMLMSAVASTRDKNFNTFGSPADRVTHHPSAGRHRRSMIGATGTGITGSSRTLARAIGEFETIGVVNGRTGNFFH